MVYSVHPLKLDLRVEYGRMLHSSECVNGVFCRPEARFGLHIFIEVSVPSQDCERSCICKLLPLSLIFLLDFESV
jgi:hypothetical protein